MLAEIFTVIAPVLGCALVGFVWARSGQPFSDEFISRLVMWIAAPCLIVGTLSKVEIEPALLEILFATVLSVLGLSAILAYVVVRVSGKPIRSFLTPLVFANTGNMGLPLSLFAFGPEGLAVSLAFFIIGVILHFSLGVVLASNQPPWRSLLSSPIVFASLLAIAMIFTDASLPLWLDNTVSLLGDLAIPLMLITLGVSLQQLRVTDLGWSIVGSVVRVVGGFLIGLLVCSWFELEGAVRGAVLIQASMPVAVFNYLLASRYNRHPQQVAGLVVVSTLVSFVTLPLLLSWIMAG